MIIGSILLILYVFAGHGFIKFYLSGKTEMLQAAEQINTQCNANQACPTTLQG